MNIIRIILIYIDFKKNPEKGYGGADSKFANTLAFYIVNVVILFIAAMMYFVERGNKLSQYVNHKVRKVNRERPPV